MGAPYILAETENFAVVFKPPRMHSAPLSRGGEDTLLDWYAAVFPGVMELCGRKKGEGGLVHRLDYETRGLVLFAKNQKSLQFFLTLQEEESFIKEYNAICQKKVLELPSFPSPPVAFAQNGLPPAPFVIQSAFRPFGPGRKQVRPVTGTPGALYQTEIIDYAEIEGGRFAFTVRLRRGFRHQIRCHLAWIGFPILNDPLYNGDASGDFLALTANSLFFTDPQTGTPQEYHLPPTHPVPAGAAG